MGTTLFPSMARLALLLMNKQKLDQKDSTYNSLKCEVEKKIRGKKCKPQIQSTLIIVFTRVHGMVNNTAETCIC